jgi:UPF0716 protein FxsA
VTRFLAGLAFLALPFLEIAGFIVVGGWIGVLPTIGLVLLAIFAGVILLRAQGAGAVNRIRVAAADGAVPGRDLAHGAMIMLAGILLIIPGFITDIMGLLLFLPPVRDLVWRLLGSRVTVFTSFGPLGARGPGRSGQTIDLDTDEYSRGGSPDSPWRRIEPQ